jgi:DNA helicase-2/ATP-dependent DNA helicase PcrA
MPFVADLHVHSRFSVATSKDMDLPHLHQWAGIKGISLVATGDVTHPVWFREISESLVPLDCGLFELKPELHAADEEPGIPTKPGSVRFILSAEISTIYKKNGKVRKVHHLLLLPDLETAARLNDALGRIGNIRSDGRPILGLDSKDLLEIVLGASEEILFIPAHAWTPHFSVLGAKSGFNSIEECFEDLTPYIHAVETGLSSDPPMNWRVSLLDSFRLLSNSDAHSPSKLARNANVMETELSFQGVSEAVRNGKGFLGTLDMYPEEGKYHYDGHRACGRRMSPEETVAHDYRCPDCNALVTVGVMHRVEELADRPNGYRPENAARCTHIIPLVEILSEIMKVGVNSKKVKNAYFDLIRRVGPELFILLDAPRDLLEKEGSDLIAEGIRRMRAGEVQVTPGYDGEFGRVKLFEAGDRSRILKQATLF